MIDLNLIKTNPKLVEDGLAKKGYKADVKEILELAEQKNKLQAKVDEIKTEKNKLSASVPVVKKEGGDIQKIFDKVKLLNVDIQKQEQLLAEVEDKLNTIVYALPNLPDSDLLPGEKENNKVIYTFGKKPEFNFKPKDHVELCEGRGLVDYERAAKISGRGTWIYKNNGAKLEWALLNFFIQEHLKDGYEFILPPHILNYESGFTAGQFPKFEKDVFWLKDVEPKKFILPTAETALVNLHRNEILTEKELPKKYFAYTPCYRCEAGSYRTEERGMIRGYQFNKVEMVQYTTEDKSDVAFDEMVKKAQTLLEKLGLHYQLSKLAAGDCSHSMARTYDIEVWIPSMNCYKEVSSVSNARDYQARRGMVRYRDLQTGKIKYCHTLNGSGLATSRVLPAIVEQFQNEDGTINVPKVLQPFVGAEII